MEQTEQKEQIKSKEEGKLEWLLPFVQGTQFDYANVFGTVAWLWSHSPLHIDWSIRMLATNVIPALQNRSFVLVRENGNPIAYASWARFSVESEKKYLRDPNSIVPDDWHSGERTWFIDWVAPFGRTDEIARIFQEKIFPDRIVRALRVRKNKTNGRIMEFHGVNVPRETMAVDAVGFRQTFIDAFTDSPEYTLTRESAAANPAR